MKRPILIALVIGALFSAQPASAQGPSSTPSQRDELVARLESRMASLDSQIARTGPPQARGDAARVIQRQQLREQRQRIQDLIEKIRSGQQIDPGDLDRVLGPEAR